YGTDHFEGNGGFVQWTDTLPLIFKKRYGYDLIEHLPELFFIVASEEFSKVRRDYRDCLSYLFSQNFGKLIHAWCEKNKLLYTGHVLAEESLRSQTMACGSAMRFYEYMQSPGIDILCAQGLSRPGGNNEWKKELLTVKQCASACNQFRKKWMLSELYGCTGWHFTFAEHKAIGDWQSALGVNLRCQHLAWYTMKGDAKRDYPASISFQSSWHKDYPIVEDYFSRVNLMLTQGEVIRDIGVIHPIESTWGLHLPGKTESFGTGKKLEKIDSCIVELQNMLLDEHYDFDYIDEDILERHGAVENKSLKVALANYKTVIIPPAVSLRKTTCNILSEFISKGGKVIFITPPKEISGINKCEFMAPLEKFSIKSSFTKNALSKILGDMKDIRRVSIRSSDGHEYNSSYYMLREDKECGRTIVFICHNIQDNSSGKIRVKIPSSGKVHEWDPQSGNIYSLDHKEKGGCITFDTDLPGYGSRLFVIEKESSADMVKKKCGRLKTVSKAKINPESWTLRRNKPNAFPLDRAHYSLDGLNWIGPLEILKLDRVIRDICSLPYRGEQMVQPWVRKKTPSFKSRDVQILFDFMIDEIPEKGVTLAMESIDKFKAELNNIELLLKETGWWIDPALRKI
ncbi:MAG: glycosyl hydrolase, partial [Lentisphaerae bacterium]|nr:glycosyl hydrolase [Lentisphaerota bacterium]